MKKFNSEKVSWVALIVAAVALIMCICCCFCCKTRMVEKALNSKPEMIIDALKNYEQKMRDEAAKEANKIIEDNIQAINNDPNSPVMGNPDGSIVLVEFFDYSCGYCHRLYPVLKNILAKNPNVKMVSKELAFLAPVSEYAAKVALAAKEQGKYAQMYDALFSVEERLTEDKVNEIAEGLGLNMDKLKADMTKAEAQLRVNNDLAQKIQINGVPVIILNGKMLQTIDESVIQEAIDNLK